MVVPTRIPRYLPRNISDKILYTREHPRVYGYANAYRDQYPLPGYRNSKKLNDARSRMMSLRDAKLSYLTEQDQVLTDQEALAMFKDKLNRTIPEFAKEGLESS